MEMSLYTAMGLVFLVGSLLLISEVGFSYRHYQRVEARMTYQEDVDYSRLLKDMLFRRVFVIGILVAVSEAILIIMQVTSFFIK